MLLYEEALETIVRRVPRPRTRHVTLQEAQGQVLAQPITARLDLPRFDSSAMDGYAISAHDAEHSSQLAPSYRVIGESCAGEPYGKSVHPGEAVRIFTGGVIPQGAESVVMQEHTEQVNGDILVHQCPEPGQNIRRRGEDVQKGCRILSPGLVIRPQHIGLMAALGYPRVKVCRRPTVAIVVTGDELQRPGRKLKRGQIYESNGELLSALVKQAGGEVDYFTLANDRLSTLTECIQEALTRDVLVISGGVSVGDKDYVREAAHRCLVKQVFWKIDMKPGKPVFFGQRQHKLVFGLPGNPVSVFVTFEELVKPALYRLMGRPWQDGYQLSATLAHDLTVSTTRRTHFIRVRRVSRPESQVGVQVEAFSKQGSHRLGGLVEADGWIRVAADDGPWPAGSPVFVKQEGGPW